MSAATASKRKQARPEPASAAPAPPPPADAGRFEPALPLASIAPSPHNPRKTFDEAELAKLTDSIRGPKGVLQPIVVRPRRRFTVEKADGEWDPGRDASDEEDDRPLTVGPVWYVVDTTKTLPHERHCDEYPTESLARDAADRYEREKARGITYEIVAGERRWRASKLAGRDTIPAVVRDLDDKAAAETAVVENDQREDVPPLEQARGYRRLLDLGDDAAGIAAKIGRSEDYVLERLQLTKLIPSLQEDLARGWITFTHARELAKVERPEDQAELRDQDLYDVHPDDCAAGEAPHVLPVDHLRRCIREAFRRDLADAPWKLDDADLVPAAGSCAACPKRSGSRPGLFDSLANGDGKKARDHCFDRTCFDQKHQALIDLGLRKAAEKAAGGEVLKVTTEQWSRDREVLPAGRYEVVSKKDAAAAGPGELRQAVIADGKKAGQVVTVRVTKEPAAAAAPAGKAPPTAWEKEQKARERKAEVGKAAAPLAAKRAADRLRRDLTEGGTVMPKGLSLFKLLTKAIASDLGADPCRIVAHRRGLPKNPTNQRQRIEDHVDELVTPADCLHLLAELAAARRAFGWGASYGGSHMSKEDKAFWSAFGVDRAKLEKEAAEALKKPAAKPAAKPSANGHAKPKAKAKRAKAAAATDGGDEDEPARSKPPASSPAKWRSLNVLDLEPSGVAAALLDTHGVETVGELADRLDVGDFLGLDVRDLDALSRAVDDVRGDDGEPHPTLARPRACRVCGCTDEDCSGCVERTGVPCSWVEDDLCSACVGQPARTGDGPPPLKGESIDQLDVSADALNAAHLALAFKDKKKLSKPLAVDAVYLNDRPHVVTAALEAWISGARAWEVRPLHTLEEYAKRHGHPGKFFVPDPDPRVDGWEEVTVAVGQAEYLIGPKGEQRRLIEPPLADPAKKQPKRKAAAAHSQGAPA